MKSDIKGAIKKLNRALKRWEAAKKTPDDCRGQGALLWLIMENEGITARELAMLLEVRPPSLTEKLNKLEAEGFARRIRNPKDQRVAHCYITDKGREVVARNIEKREKSLLDVHCLTSEESEQFIALAENLSACLEQEALYVRNEQDKEIIRQFERNKHKGTQQTVS